MRFPFFGSLPLRSVNFFRAITGVLLGFATPLACLGVPAANTWAEFAQPDGTPLRAKLAGDEWFHWHETPEGYVIGRDLDGQWKYQRARRDRAGFDFVPGAVVGRFNPAALGLRPRDLPTAALIRDRVRTLRNPAGTRPQASLDGASAAAQGAETGSSASTAAPGGAIASPAAASPIAANLRCVVILAAFNDHWDVASSAPLASRGLPRAAYDALCNTPGYSADGAAGSARDYYREISYGRTDITFVVSDWVRLPHGEAYYGDNAHEVSGEGRSRLMAAHAVAAADHAGFDFAQGDGDEDGWVDMLVVIYSGYSEAHPGNPSTTLWPRQWVLPDVESRDGKKMHAYASTSAMRGLQSSAEGIMRIGTLVHEMGHLFGLPDLYDHAGLTRGVGAWGLMAYGGWGASGGAATEHRPTHMEAFSKMLLGYLDPQPVHSCNEHALPRLATSPSAHLWREAADADEYFLAENRGGAGFDSDLPPGLLITHVDARVLSAANNSAAFATPALRVEEAVGGDTLRTFGGASAAHVWTASHGLPGGFRDDTGNPGTNAMRYQPGAEGPHGYFRDNNPAFHTGIVATNFSPPGAWMTYRLQTRVPSVAAPAEATAGSPYAVSWSAASGAVRYELQEGTATTASTFFDDAESTATMRANWEIYGAVARSTHGNTTPGGSTCYELAGLLPGADGVIHTADDLFMPIFRGLALRTPFTLTPSTVIRFKYLTRRFSGHGPLRVQLTADNGVTWSTLRAYDGYVPSWTLAEIDYTALQAAGFAAGDVCRLRFVAKSEYRYGWDDFPAFGYALDDIQLTGISRDATQWTTLANNLTTTSHVVAGKPGGTAWRYRVRAYAGSTWRDWSPATEVSIHTSALAAWRQTHFDTTENTGDASDLSDPDQDGLPNLVEYALNSSPTSAADARHPAVHVADSRLQITFLRARTDVTYIVEASSDLSAWTLIATNPGTVSLNTPVTVADGVSLTDQPRRFLRLRVSQ